MAYWHPLLPTALQEYEELQEKNKTAAMTVSVESTDRLYDLSYFYCL